MIQIVPYRPVWPDEFREFGGRLRSVVGERALAIHHIGSTSVPNLCAKDIIDIQVTVRSLDPAILDDLLTAGYVRPRLAEDHCPPGMTLPDEELAKMIAGVPDRRIHIHIRVEGRFNQRYPLLCRDYLRTHNSAADAYGRVKEQLARYFPEDVEAYYDVKDPVFDIIHGRRPRLGSTDRLGCARLGCLTWPRGENGPSDLILFLSRFL